MRIDKSRLHAIESRADAARAAARAAGEREREASQRLQQARANLDRFNEFRRVRADGRPDLTDRNGDRSTPDREAAEQAVRDAEEDLGRARADRAIATDEASAVGNLAARCRDFIREAARGAA